MYAYNEKTRTKKEVIKDTHGSKYIKETEFRKIYINSLCFLNSGYVLKTEEKEIR